MAFAAALIYILWLPDVAKLKKTNPATTAYMQLRQHQAEKSGKKFVKKMTWVNLKGISEHLIHAAIIAEDDTFYLHKGIDWQQMRIAVKINLQKRRFAYGGSTITQQVARNLYLSPSKNPLRKIKEMIIARMLESKLGKKRILEIYLNIAEWGKGIFGAEAASQAYFNKPASDLNPEEAAALVSVLPSPRRWNPAMPTRYIERRKRNILGRMVSSGYLPDEVDEETVEAKFENINPASSTVTASLNPDMEIRRNPQ